MSDKLKGTILAVAGGIGTVWALINATPWMPWAIAFVFCAVICADGVATLVTEVRADRELEKAKRKHEVPQFLDLDAEVEEPERFKVPEFLRESREGGRKNG